MQTSNHRFKRRKRRYRKLIWVSILFDTLFRNLFLVSILFDTLFWYPVQESILFDTSLWYQFTKFTIWKKSLSFSFKKFLNDRSDFSSWSTPWFFSRNLKPKYSSFGICNHEILSWARNLVKMDSKGKKGRILSILGVFHHFFVYMTSQRVQLTKIGLFGFLQISTQY